jgi:PHD/YefM family antitoxin component YafN of YafNO toxin-antitoxin module
MLNTNVTDFKDNIFGLLAQAIKHGEPVSIRTEDGTAVVISEEDYNGLMETIYACSVPGMRERIIEGLRTPVSECVPEDEIKW